MNGLRQIEGDEPGFNGITRDQQVQLLTDPFRDVYEHIVFQFVKGNEVLEADIPDDLKTPWMGMVNGWRSRTPVHLNGFDETGAYLKYGDHDLLWVPADTKEHTYKIPLCFNIPSSLVRAAEVIFDADNEHLKKEPPVREWELSEASHQGDSVLLRHLSRIMIVQGKSSGIALPDLYNHPF